MGHRNMICSTQMIGLEMDQQGQSYMHPHPEPCVIFGGIPNILPPDVPPMPGNTTNIDAHHPPERYENAVFYQMPQYRGVQHHPHHVLNLDLGIATPSNLYMPYMNPSASISLNYGDHIGNYGVIGGPSEEYGRSSHFIDNAPGLYKRKNAEGNPGHSQFFNASASSSSSASLLNGRHPENVAPMEAAPFTQNQRRGNTMPSIRETGLPRNVRNGPGVGGLDTHNGNHFIQGTYIGQPFPVPPLWEDQQLSSNSTDASASAWTPCPTIPFIHGNNVNGVSSEINSMAPSLYYETVNNGSSSHFFHPSPPPLQLHGFHQLSAAIQAPRGQNINVLPQVPPAPYRVPTTYALQSAMGPPEDGLNIGLRPAGSVQPMGLRMYRPHREGAVPQTSLRHRNLPHLRVLPTDGVALLEFPDYHEVESYVDHHRDMRLDIEDMSYEELLALGERIGNVGTGLSEETIRSQLKTRKYVSPPTSINLEEPASMDQESDSCIICQDEYKSEENIATLGCGHEYHEDCLKKWLRLKNVCPVCKSEALSTVKDA